MARVYANANKAAARHVDTRRAVREERDKVTRRAQDNLAQARASTPWHKIDGPEHMTRIEESEKGVDALTHLVADNAMALEFGHALSVVFGGTETKAPEGLYILTRAAYGG